MTYLCCWDLICRLPFVTPIFVVPTCSLSLHKYVVPKSFKELVRIEKKIEKHTWGDGMSESYPIPSVDQRLHLSSIVVVTRYGT